MLNFRRLTVTHFMLKLEDFPSAQPMLCAPTRALEQPDSAGVWMVAVP